MAKTIREVLLQYCSECNQGLNQLAGRGTPEDQALADIEALLAKELIGEDEPQPHGNQHTDTAYVRGRNNLRIEQRRILKELIGGQDV